MTFTGRIRGPSLTHGPSPIRGPSQIRGPATGRASGTYPILRPSRFRGVLRHRAPGTDLRRRGREVRSPSTSPPPRRDRRYPTWVKEPPSPIGRWGPFLGELASSHQGDPWRPCLPEDLLRPSHQGGHQLPSHQGDRRLSAATMGGPRLTGCITVGFSTGSSTVDSGVTVPLPSGTARGRIPS